MHGRSASSAIGTDGHRARLRARLFEGGGKALLDHELVEYLLALAIPRRDTKAQAKELIARYGGIGPLLAASADTLRREGLSDSVIGALKIAEATALRLLETRAEGAPVLSSWDALTDYLHTAMMSSNHLIRDWTYELLLLIEQAKAEAANDDDFALGRKFGLAEALSLMQQQARSFGFNAADLGLPGEDVMTTSLGE